MKKMDIRELLTARRKDELEEAAIRLGLEPLKSSAKKADWVEYILREMPERKDCVRLMLRLPAFEAMRKAAETGKRIVADDMMDDDLLDSLCALRRIGLARFVSGGWEVQPDAAAYLTVAKEEEIDLRMNDLLYDIMRGWMMHVGMMPVPVLLDQVTAILPPMPDDEREAAKDVCFALLVARMGMDCFLPEDDALWVVHEDVNDPEKLLERLREPHIAALEYPVFTPEELAGCTRLLCLPGGEELYQPLRREMEKLGFEDECADDLLDDMVYLIQNDDGNEALAVILDAAGDIPDWQMERLIQLCTELSNRIPRWSNKGHSAEELLGMHTPRRLPKMPGRNDPCTCGSGKKYKLCCGRRLN